MTTPQPRFLEPLLAGEPLDQTALQGFIDQRVEEDLHLEYKAADWLNPETHDGGPKPSHGLRRYTGGFANAEGGVLVVGVRHHQYTALVRCQPEDQSQGYARSCTPRVRRT